MDLEKLKNEAFETAKAHGWHDEELPDETYLMLIITEIAEAVQADRKNRHAFLDSGMLKMREFPDRTFETNFNWLIKGTVEEELSDIIIRCLDLAGLRGFSLDGVTDDIQTFHVHDYSLVRLCYAMCCHVTAIIPLRNKIADVIAYTLAWCSYNNIDIEFFIEQKMKYNKLRAYKHGNKRY